VAFAEVNPRYILDLNLLQGTEACQGLPPRVRGANQNVPPGNCFKYKIIAFHLVPAC
jgi:hypothetical protein